MNISRGKGRGAWSKGAVNDLTIITRYWLLVTSKYQLGVILVMALVMLYLTPLLQAQGTWVGPGSLPPPTGSLNPIAGLGGDGLGSHIAEQDLNLNGHSIYNLSNVGIGWALAATSTGSGLGAQLAAIDGSALSITNNQLEWPALTLYNAGSGPALSAQSAGSPDAAFSQSLILDNGNLPGSLQLGGSNNILSLAAQGSAPSQNFYWGDQVICYKDDPSGACGFFDQVIGDNLGNHIATSELDMNGYRILNIGDQDPFVGGLDANSTAGSPALSSVSNEWHGLAAVNYNIGGQTGAYAVKAENSGAGYGLLAASAFGPAGRFYGLTKVLDDVVPAQVVFTKESDPTWTHNRLSTVADSFAPHESLYWGDKKLCDGTQAGCGFSAVPGFEFWKTTADSNLLSDKVVSIGGQSRYPKLEVLMPFDATFGQTDFTEAGYGVTDIEPSGRRLYSAWQKSDNSASKLVIYNAPVSGGLTLPGRLTLATGLVDIEVVGKYVYGLLSSGHLLVINATNPAGPSLTLDMDIGGSPRRLLSSGSRLFIVGGSQLKIYDISLPASPALISTLNDGRLVGNDLAQAGALLFAADGDQGLQVIDVSNVNSPQILGGYVDFIADPAQSLAVSGSLLYTVAGDSLYVLQYQGNGSLVLLSRYDFIKEGNRFSPQDIVTAGRYAYVIYADQPSYVNPSGLGQGLLVLDISNPASVSFRAGSSVSGSQIAMFGAYLFVGSDTALKQVENNGSQFNALDISVARLDTLNAFNMTVSQSLYIQSGLAVGGDLTVSQGDLAVSSGNLRIGNTIVTEQLLQQLLAWLAS